MGRAPLPLGTHGNVTTRRLDEGGWVAQCRFRDYDGVTRRVVRRGATQGKAQEALQRELRDRAGLVAGVLTPASTFSDAAEVWRRDIELGELRPTSVRTYCSVLERWVLPGMGQLRLREVRVPHIQNLLTGARRQGGLSAASLRMIRKVVSGVLQTAVTHGALDVNPARQVAQIKGGAVKEPRALSRRERAEFLELMDQRAAGTDLPDLARFMLGTGVRIGEALAVRWRDLGVAQVEDIEVAVVEITGNIVRVKGEGLVRHAGKTFRAQRTVALPQFVVDLLERRWSAEMDPDEPVFRTQMGYRDPSNTSRSIRIVVRDTEFEWVTSHVFRKTAATIWDEAKLTARQGADTLGHAKVSMTQDFYFGRRQVHVETAAALDAAYGWNPATDNEID